MADDDFFDDDEAAFGEPVHPDDRLWRHPSELHKVPPPGARSIPDTVDFAPVPSRRQWGALALAGLAGAAMAVSVITMTGLGERVIDSGAGVTETAEPAGFTRQPDVDTTTTTQPVSTTTTVDSPPPPPPLPDYSQAAAFAAPSMVWIRVAADEEVADCAGLVVRSDGHVVTDSSLFVDGAVITVRLHDGSVAAGELVAVDPVTELAVVRVDRQDLIPATTGDPRQLRAGAPVLLLAPEPTGQAAAHTAMVNAVGTPALADGRTTLYDMIQFDVQVPAAISGGPLLDTEGNVVGVTMRAGQGEPYGFATPIDAVTAVAESIIDQGRAQHPWLGVEVGQNGVHPALIDVTPDGPAHVGGLAPNDLIVAVDGDPVPSMAAFVTMIRAHRPGDQVTITYRRDGVDTDCIVVLGER